MSPRFPAFLLAGAFIAGGAYAQPAPTSMPSQATQSADNPEHPGSINAGVSASGVAVSVATLPERGRVMLKGVVQDIGGEEDFVLSDASGSIEVDAEENISLKRGDLVTVNGEIELMDGKKTINNAHVTVNGNGPLAKIR